MLRIMKYSFLVRITVSNFGIQITYRVLFFLVSFNNIKFFIIFHIVATSKYNLVKYSLNFHRNTGQEKSIS